MPLGGLADGNGERRCEGAGRDLDAISGNQALGLADRRIRACGIAKEKLDLAAVHAAALVDHVTRDLHGLPVLKSVLCERACDRKQHADPDRLLRGCDKAGERKNGEGRHRCKRTQDQSHEILPCQHNTEPTDWRTLPHRQHTAIALFSIPNIRFMNISDEAARGADQGTGTMDLRKAQYFFAVLEHRNLSNAAHALRVSQPTLSRQMQALEEEFGMALFIRHGRGMQPTEAGKRLHEGLLGLERRMRSLKSDITSAATEPTGEIAFGIPPSPRRLFAVSLIKQFAEECPRVTVRVSEETSGELRDLVASGVLDVAITNFHEPMRDMSAEPLGREQMYLVGPPAAKLSMNTETSIGKLADLPLILTTRPNSLAPDCGGKPQPHRQEAGYQGRSECLTANDRSGHRRPWLYRPTAMRNSCLSQEQNR